MCYSLLTCSVRTTLDKFYPSIENTSSKVSVSKKKPFGGDLFEVDMGSEADDSVDEVKEYIDGKVAAASTDVFTWWKDHEVVFPRLSRMARDFLGKYW